MSIPTLDNSVIQKRVDQILQKYPADSLTPRDVIANIPFGDDSPEDMAQRLNSVLTQRIYQQAEEFVKTLPPPKKGFAMSALPKEIAYPDRRAVDAAHREAVTNDLLATIKKNFKC